MDSFEVKKEVPVPKSDLKNDEIIEKSHSAYCTLCKVLLRVGALDDHLNGKKHKKNLKEKCTMTEINSTNFIITEPTQMPYYCTLCEVFCGSENSWGLHLNGKQHDMTMLHYELCNIQKENGNDLAGKEHTVVGPSTDPAPLIISYFFRFRVFRS